MPLFDSATGAAQHQLEQLREDRGRRKLLAAKLPSPHTLRALVSLPYKSNWYRTACNGIVCGRWTAAFNVRDYSDDRMRTGSTSTTSASSARHAFDCQLQKSYNGYWTACRAGTRVIAVEYGDAHYRITAADVVCPLKRGVRIVVATVDCQRRKCIAVIACWSDPIELILPLIAASSARMDSAKRCLPARHCE
jgi:hypothetical protein